MDFIATREELAAGTCPGAIMTQEARQILIEELGEPWVNNLMFFGPTIDEDTARKIAAQEKRLVQEIQ